MIIKKESQESGSGVSIYVTKSSVSRACTFSLTLSLALFGWPTLPPPPASPARGQTDRPARRERMMPIDASTAQHSTGRRVGGTAVAWASGRAGGSRR